MAIPYWQRFIGLIIYMLPWSDAIPFGRNLFIEFPLLQWLTIPAIPLIIVRQYIPFGGLLLFFILFLAVIRNPNMPYFIRFNTLQALLIDIGMILITYACEIFFKAIGDGLTIRTLSSTIVITMLTIIIFATSQCLQGKEPDLPGISEAVKMQL